MVHVEHVQRLIGDGRIDATAAAYLGIVAHPRFDMNGCTSTMLAAETFVSDPCHNQTPAIELPPDVHQFRWPPAKPAVPVS